MTGVNIISEGGCYRPPTEQGPAWLADLLYCPPDWLLPAAYAAVGLCLLLAVVGYRRSGGLDEQVVKEMAGNGGLVVSIAAATYFIRGLFMPGYAVTVALGFALGTGFWLLAGAALMDRIVEEELPGEL